MTDLTMRQAIDVLEYAAVDKENGWLHLRAGSYKGNAHGLYPVWNGAGLVYKLKLAVAR